MVSGEQARVALDPVTLHRCAPRLPVHCRFRDPTPSCHVVERGAAINQGTGKTARR
jgi:hypothetical protein